MEEKEISSQLNSENSTKEITKDKASWWGGWISQAKEKVEKVLLYSDKTKFL